MTVSLEALRSERPDVFTAACPTRTVLDHVMSKWGVLVLLALGAGTFRWSELRRAVDGISEKMLAATLRTLEGDGLVTRRAYPEIPPKVEYSLTPLGENLSQLLAHLREWSEEHAPDILAARQRYVSAEVA